MACVEKTYGDALFQLLCEEDEQSLTDVLGQLKSVDGILRDNPDFVRLLKAPTVTGKEKQDVLKEIFGGKVHAFVLNLLMLLTENGRIGYFAKLVDYFTALHNDYKNIADVTVTSAFPLSEEMQEKIKTKMTAVTGKTVNLSVKVDKSVIGGAVISYGNTTIDGSVKTRLEQLRGEIAGA